MGFMCYKQNFDLSHPIFQLLAKQQIPEWTTNSCSAPSPHHWKGAHFSLFIQRNPSDKCENAPPPLLFSTQNYELVHGTTSDMSCC